MKKTLFFALVAFFFACQNQQKTSDKEVNTEQSTKKEEGNNRFPSALQGFWVDAVYLKSLQNGTSFGAAQQTVLGEATTIEVGDTSAMIGLSFHEGMGCIFQEVDKTHFSVLNPYSNNEKVYDIECVDANTVKMGKTTFTKIGTAKYGVAALDFLLVGGNYKLKSGDTAVQFKEDGTVTGLGDFTNYTLLYDCTGETDMPNQIALSKDSENPTYFAFAKKSASLSIFDVKCVKKEDNFCVKGVKGKLRWELNKAL